MSGPFRIRVEAALIQAGFLRERCAEPEEFSCGVCGSRIEGSSATCPVCFQPNENRPGRCLRCQQQVSTSAISDPDGLRECSSVASWKAGDLPAFAPQLEPIWLTSRDAGLQAVTEEGLLAQILSGEVDGSVGVARLGETAMRRVDLHPELQAAWEELKKRQEAAEKLRKIEEERRLAAERAAAKEAKKAAEHQARVAAFVVHLKVMISPLRITLTFAIMIAGLAAFYFLATDLPAFVFALFTAGLTLLGAVIEAQFRFLAMKRRKAVPATWWSTLKDDTAFIALFAIPGLVMLVQIFGGVLYGVWNWIRPIEPFWLSVMLPHTITHMLWFLLVAPLTTLCLVGIPMFVFDLQVVAHCRRLLKQYT